MKVLIVDEDFQIDIVAKVLQSRHPADQFDVIGSLGEARNELWRNKYDRIVLDIMLPADDEAVPGSEAESGLIAGILLFDLISKDTSCINRKTPVVILTALDPAMHDRVQRAQDLFGPQFVIKPPDPDRFYKVIQDAKCRE